jgi:hypothetical protein
MALLRQGRASG